MRHKLSVLALLLLLAFCSQVSAEFIVHTIYFQPTNAQHIVEVKDKISGQVLLSQDFYKREMDKHGFGEKTYRLEKHNTGQVLIHHVRGKNASHFYVNETSKKVFAELPHRFNQNTAPSSKKDKVLIIVVGGIRLVNGESSGVGWPFTTGRYGGACVLAYANPNFNERLITHEIGHCFGLYHKPLSETNKKQLLHYEARWLDKHYHFNKRQNNGTFPRTEADEPQMSHVGQTLKVKFELPVRSNKGLHQAYIFATSKLNTLAWDYLNGKQQDTIVFELDRRDWVNIYLQVMDIDGSYIFKKYNITLPPLPENIDPNKNKNPEDIDEPDEDGTNNKTDEIPESVTPYRKKVLIWGILKKRR